MSDLISLPTQATLVMVAGGSGPAPVETDKEKWLLWLKGANSRTMGGFADSEIPAPNTYSATVGAAASLSASLLPCVGITMAFIRLSEGLSVGLRRRRSAGYTFPFSAFLAQWEVVVTS